jgi:uncharacterized protein
MTARLIRSLEATPQRWRNGGGSTRELLAWPAASDWQVRVSVADIETDGPFSAYPGVERWFTVLQGAGVELTIDGTSHRLNRGDAPLQFAGAAPANCRLIDGPTRDLNLMLRRASGSLQTATDGQAWSPAGTQCGLFTAVAGTCIAGLQRHELPPYALLWFDQAPASLSFTAGQRPAGLIGWWLAATPQQVPA